MRKGRGLVAENGWDLSEDEEAPEETEEIVNLCLMARSDESTPMEKSTTNHEVTRDSTSNLNVASCSSDNLNVHLSSVDYSSLDSSELIHLVNSLKSSLDDMNCKFATISS